MRRFIKKLSIGEKIAIATFCFIALLYVGCSMHDIYCGGDGMMFTTVGDVVEESNVVVEEESEATEVVVKQTNKGSVKNIIRRFVALQKLVLDLQKRVSLIIDFNTVDNEVQEQISNIEKENSVVTLKDELNQDVIEDATLNTPDQPVEQEPAVPVHTHEYNDEVVNPTCAENGYTVYSCECGDTYNADTKEKLGHAYESAVVSATCTKDGYTTYTCERCNHSYTDNKTGAFGHSYTKEVVEPTYTSEGYTKHTCSTCGDVYKDNYKNKLVYYEEVNQTVYATTDVNIRKGPGTSYDKVGRLHSGNSITRIGIGENGWSKVKYNGETAYISSNYLTKTKPVPPFDGTTPSADIQAKRDANPNLVGVLYIPSVGMSPVNVYRPAYKNELQSLADKKNSAYAAGVYMFPELEINRIEIGDHNTHNFCYNKKIAVGDTAYLNMGNRVVRMRCVSTVKSMSVNDYVTNGGSYDGMIVTIACSGDGGRTVNCWSITSDSDVSYETLYEIVTAHCKIVY